jgi:DNA polymerase
MPEADMTELCELFDWIESGQLVEAHNAAFERAMWRNQAVPAHGWPEVPNTSWRCSAAKAAALSLPRSLEDAIEALFLEVKKDTEGAALMKKMVKPRNPLKAERTAWGRKHAPCGLCGATGKVPGVNPETGRRKNFDCGRCDGRGYDRRVSLPDMPTLYHESREQLERLFAYCRQDVLAEESLSDALPDLSDGENELYLLDQTINERGFMLDEEAIEVALELIDSEFADLNAELCELTGGEVERATQRARMLVWLAKEGLELEDTTADTIDSTLERHDLAAHVRRALELMRTLGRSSTAKFEKMRDWICPDARVRGGLLFHGATTGRWTGSGIQPHNFPRGEARDTVTEKPPDPELLWAFLKTKDRELISAEYGDTMTALSSGLRGVIIATPGKELFVSDFSGIEARVLFWAADDQVGLQIFREGRDIYNEMATTIYGYPVNRKVAEHDTQGKLGKVAILGLGYQMGAGKFVQTAFDMGGVVIPEDLFCKTCKLPSSKHKYANHQFAHDAPDTMTSVKVVNAYRSKFWRVKEMWGKQEQAAIRAVQRKGQVFECGEVAWFVSGDFLYCELPSGRMLAYPYPKVVDRVMPWGDERPALTYMGINQYTRKWQRQDSYGGMLTENIVQAIARDLIAAAMVRCEEAGYQVILSVHDELLAEALAGRGNVKEFNALMAEVPPWAGGCPVEAEGWSGLRYKK